ncbi:unnamed protein product [Nezara viridula]|uniref:Neuropeptide n=2 Tax=Nezara viridula TaxID=85310 RepID=A0A9P0EAV6_NEZVI|nr:unnamed protein product [Nezara viridula]
MGVLWLLSMTIICHTTQRITAWPGGNQSSTSTSKPVFENHTINTLEELPLRKSIVNSSEENMREKRGTISNENTIESDLEKRDQKYKFSSWGGKRNHIPEEKRAKFSSWGGKRSYELGSNEIDEDIQEEKRARFSSWGGKRSDNDAEKRARFSSWAGKRNLNEISEDKRSKFNSWAGKRMDLEGDKRAKFSSWAGKRARFNSWAGKRSDNVFYDEKRVPFNSWAGKRNYLEPENEYETAEDKRAKFSSWAGKRSYFQPNTDEDEISEVKREKFSSWAGKRAPDYVGIPWNSPDNKLRYYSNAGGEQGSENIMKLWQDLMSRKRARFSSWAGKRSDETVSDNESLIRFLKPEAEEKRAKFSSWAGKRDDIDTNKVGSWGGNQGNESVGDLNNGREYPSMIVKRSAYSWNSPSIAYKRKPIFSSWGGKRSDDSHTIQARSLPMQRVLFNGVKDRSWGSLLRPIRRGPDFYAWGGKRST